MNALTVRFNVISALILRDMRTRFGRSYLGYLIAVGWPFSHLVVLVGAMAYVRRLAPMGGDPAIWAITGVLPYILCLYPARIMGYAIEHNRALFFFPVVKASDVIISRAIVEFMTATIVVVLAFVVAAIIGIDVIPIDSFVLASGVLMTIYLSLSIGILNNIMASIFRMWHLVFILCIIVMYLSSGTIIAVDTLSAELRDAIWYNPLFHCVEWIRSSYYEGYGDGVVSKHYVFWVATANLLISLSGERFLRGKILQP